MTTTIASVQLTSEQYQALSVAKKRLLDSYPIRELILFGSVARSQAGPDYGLCSFGERNM